MPELEFSVINFSRLCNDVEKLKTVFECQTLDCSLDNKRLLILSKPNSRFHVLYSENKMKIKHIYMGVGNDRQSCLDTDCLPSPTEADLVEENIDCMCEMSRPPQLDNVGSYRCVVPGKLLQALKVVEELVKNRNISESKIVLGMGNDFYIKFRGSCYNYDLVAEILSYFVNTCT